jgi:phospholipase C
MPKRPDAKSDTRAAAGQILMIRPPGCTGQQLAAPARNDQIHGVGNASHPGSRDLVHRFYQEQYRLNGGRQNRYVNRQRRGWPGIGVYATRSLPIYAYLHQDSHPHYTIVDSFFQAALRGSRARHRPARQRHADTPGPVRAASTASRTC